MVTNEIKEKIKQKINSFFFKWIDPLLGKIFIFQPLHFLISHALCASNRELYRKSLVKNLNLKFSISRDWIRIPMYSAIFNFFDKFSKKENFKNKIAIEIGGSEGSVRKILETFGVDYKVAPNYPEIDIHHLPYKDNSFDFLILDQVLEHVEKPWIAVEEVFRVLKPGGICIATAPFLYGYHPSPKDYFRYTPDGWRSLFSKFEILEADGWGNVELVKITLNPAVINTHLGHTIPVDEALNKKLLEYNDRKNYFVTWCIARKPF